MQSSSRSAAASLLTVDGRFADLGFARVDTDRERRQGAFAAEGVEFGVINNNTIVPYAALYAFGLGGANLLYVGNVRTDAVAIFFDTGNHISPTPGAPGEQSQAFVDAWGSPYFTNRG